MTRQEAEKLLGGYATGTLTEQERSLLFSAALEHQELFDALAGEEALRELLADAAARRRLLGELSESRRPFWRPLSAGLAASLAGAALLFVVLFRHSSAPPPPPAPMMAHAPVPHAVVPAPPAPPAKKTKPTAPRAHPAKPLTELEPPPPPPIAALSGAPAAPGALRSPGVGGVIGGVPPAGMEAITLAALTPVHTFQLLDNGTARVTVNSPSGGNVYLVKRPPGGAVVIRSLRSAAGPMGTTQAEFEFPLSPSDAVDLYVLPKPAADPGSLPAGGVAEGYYRRIYPQPQANPPRP